MTMRNVNTIFAAGLAALALAGCSDRANVEAPSATATVTATNLTLTPGQRQRVHISTVQSSTFHKTIDTTGTIDFDGDQSTVVLAPMSGPVARLLVSLGQEVKSNQPLAEVDSPDFATAISAYRKALAMARISKQLAEQDEDLLQHHGVSLREADQAKIDAANAAADTESAFQQLVALKVDPDTLNDIKDGKPTKPVKGLIRSPISGTVVDRPITQGELLEAGTTTCFNVADLSKVWVMADLYESDLGDVALGDSAEIICGATTNHFSGVVDNISAVVDPNTRSVAVRVAVDNPQGVLKMQMYVRVWIHSRAEHSGILAPVSATLRNDENLPFVYVTLPDGSFQRAPIVLGARVGDQCEIKSGLKPGDQVVSDGAVFVQFLQDQ